ncbi:HdeD family acid-resistance protein [Kaistella flava (ex Peng et al. 2021)]|uniref:HdeD family acid-resistance protein n=2 Tax=Kaistella flava (ex Peng et al. 2021) TaxID=2038776 RepID=A0A7M2YEQ2_9FLAO|nr:HdeD family acid-resistance protein [Kaistella flava (ex Peng et al. 2021)]
MKTSFLNSIKNSVKHWYIPLIVGLLFIILSFMVFTSPLSSLLALSVFFAISFLLGGLSEVIFSISNKDTLPNWGWSLVFGMLTSIVGLSLMIHPALSLSVLSFYIGFLLLFRSISSISFALDIKKYGSKNWGSLLIFGILGAIASLFLIWNPLFTGIGITILIAVSFLFAGLFSIFLAFQLRKIHVSTKDISAQLRERYNDLMQEIDNEWKG